MDKTDRRFIAIMLLGVCVALFLITLKVGELEDRIEALEQPQSTVEMVKEEAK